MKKILIFLLALSAQISYSQKAVQSEKKDEKRIDQPKLVVGIVIDQMRYDYIYRYWNKYGSDGFKRLLDQGYFCKNANYNYVPTYTAPGHASIFTGTTPAIHGIIANTWYSKDLGKNTYCTDDKAVKCVGSNSIHGEMSPKYLLTTTIGDELRLSNNLKSKVIGIALKDRGAILPAGHTANAAYWFDNTNGAWITSTFYMNALPGWVNEFNKRELAKAYLAQKWNTLLPIEQYTESTMDNSPHEGLFMSEKLPVFPHDLPSAFTKEGFELIRTTPFGNTLTREFAIEAIKSEKLGKGDFTDFVSISFSSPDYIGHKFGINSIEIEDTYLRLDKEIAELLKFLDGYLGKENILLFLTADHAAPEVPAYLSELKIPAGYFYRNEVRESLKKYLTEQYGDSLFLSFYGLEIILDKKKIEEKKLSVETIENQVAGFVMQFKGVAGAVTGTTLRNSNFTEGVNSFIQKGYNAQRSGDVIINLEPGWIEFYKSKTGTTHGSPYSYDTHVPLIWYGWQIKNGSSTQYMNIIDIAPTIALMLNIQFPNGCLGRPVQGLLKNE